MGTRHLKKNAKRGYCKCGLFLYEENTLYREYPAGVKARIYKNGTITLKCCCGEITVLKKHQDN